MDRATLKAPVTTPRRTLRDTARTGWQAVERALDAALGALGNPLRHLGALGFLAFWLLAASGIVLYIQLDTSVAGAWASIDALARWPLASGRLLRGVHRYAADLLVLVLFAHLLREWLMGHTHGARRYPWLTGVPLIGFVFVCAIGGFWLNWDALGQYSALATAQWLDALPLWATPLSRNFLLGAQVSDRLFSLFVFVHLGVGLFFVFALWFHIQRLTRAAIWPPRPLALGTVAALAALALLLPVRSHAPADLARAGELLRLDWLVLFVHPLVAATSAGWVWAGVGAATLLLFALPFLPRRLTRVSAPAEAPAETPAAAPAPAAVAVVDEANCNGCRRCFADCPYAAVTMVPHPDAHRQGLGRELALVDPDLCVGCGICAGACPSSTPFRRQEALLTGIDMPQRPVDALRRQLQAGLHQRRGAPQAAIVVFGCDQGARLATLAREPDVVVLSLLCAGQLPPSFVEYALRDGAGGVLVAACRESGCEFRHGERLLAERLDGRREPHLREQVERGRVLLAPVGRGDEAELAAALAALRRQLSRRQGEATPPAAKELST